MNVLAIECSSARGQVTCLCGDQVLATVDVAASRSRAAALFAALEQARAQAGWPDWSVVDLFAAGRGPGRYSGMRVALTAAQHLALPVQQSVRAVDSGWALAAERAAATPNIKEIWVVGDARRNRIWRGRFACQQGVAHSLGTWVLLDVPECLNDLKQLTRPGETCVMSSEWDRLEFLNEGRDESAATAWQRVSATPTAEWVGRLAIQEEESGMPVHPPVPLYLHPPVEPRVSQKGS